MGCVLLCPWVSVVLKVFVAGARLFVIFSPSSSPLANFSCGVEAGEEIAEGPWRREGVLWMGCAYALKMHILWAVDGSKVVDET